jgi:hypothetical protein
MYLHPNNTYRSANMMTCFYNCSNNLDNKTEYVFTSTWESFSNDFLKQWFFMSMESYRNDLLISKHWLSLAIKSYRNDFLKHWISITLKSYWKDFLKKWLSITMKSYSNDTLKQWLYVAITSEARQKHLIIYQLTDYRFS